MEEKFERIEKHLYRRQYQTVDGKLSTLHYARFKDWKGKLRKFPLNSNLDMAREELTVLRVRNRRHDDFDLDRQKPEPEPERLTVAKYLPRFLETKKAQRSYDFWEDCGNHLARLLGPVPLEEITRSKIAEYKQIRLAEPIRRHGKPVDAHLVSPSTVNREITTLIGLLNLAAEDGVLEKIPATRKLKIREDQFSRERVLDVDEYNALLEASPRWLQRVIIGAYETCLSRADLLKLTWAEVHRKRPEAAIVKLMSARAKTKVKQKVPISPTLADVLDELGKEQRKVKSLQGPSVVFTWDGQPIKEDALRKAFDRAKKDAKIEDFHFHDFRHCAVTRWALVGIPEEVRKLAAGHSRGSVHQRYVNPPDELMVKIFAECLGWNWPAVGPRNFANSGAIC